MDGSQKSSSVIKFKPTSQGQEIYDHPYNSSQTIQKIKQAIACHYNIQFQQIKLIFKGKILSDKQKAGDCNLQNAAVMLVINKKVQQQKKVTTDQTINKIPSSFSTGMGGSQPVGFGNYNLINHPGYMSAISNAVDQQKMEQMLNDPMTMSMAQELMQDPDTLRYLIDKDPMMKSMFKDNPMMKQLLDNPEMMKTVFNPQTMKMASEMMKNRNNPNSTSTNLQGNNQLGSFGGLGSLGGLGGLGGFGGLGNMGGFGNMGGLPMMGLPPQNQTGQSNSQQQNIPQFPLMGNMNPFLMGLQNSQVGLNINQVNSQNNQGGREIGIEQKYKSQLKELESMGFKDREQNIKVLIESKGDVDGAIERLCQD